MSKSHLYQHWKKHHILIPFFFCPFFHSHKWCGQCPLKKSFGEKRKAHNSSCQHLFILPIKNKSICWHYWFVFWQKTNSFLFLSRLSLKKNKNFFKKAITSVLTTATFLTVAVRYAVVKNTRYSAVAEAVGVIPHILDPRPQPQWKTVTVYKVLFIISFFIIFY